jgi:hypothetical protein
VPKQDFPGRYEFAAAPVWNDPDSRMDTDFPTYESTVHDRSGVVSLLLAKRESTAPLPLRNR